MAVSNAAGRAKQPEQPEQSEEQQQQQHAFLIPMQLECRAALARICHGFLERIRLHGLFFDPREEVGSLRVSRVCALVNNCGPAAAKAFVDVAWERISMLVTMAEAQQAKSPLLCNLAYVHTGRWIEAQVGEELKRGRGKSAARQRVALSLQRDVGAIQRDDRGYRKLVAGCSRWLALVRTFSVGVMAIPFQELKIRRCGFSYKDIGFLWRAQLMFSADSTCSARASGGATLMLFKRSRASTTCASLSRPCWNICTDQAQLQSAAEPLRCSSEWVTAPAHMQTLALQVPAMSDERLTAVLAGVEPLPLLRPRVHGVLVFLTMLMKHAGGTDKHLLALGGQLQPLIANACSLPNAGQSIVRFLPLPFTSGESRERKKSAGGKKKRRRRRRGKKKNKK
jgi:hypothetical protein